MVFHHFIEIESKTTVAKTEGLSKFLPIWSMFKDAPSMKDVGSTLARSVRSDSLFVRNVGLSKLQRSGFSIEITCITLISILFIFLCSQWYSKNVYIGEMLLVLTFLDHISKMLKNKWWPVTNSFHFSSEQKYGGQEMLNLQTESLPLKKIRVRNWLCLLSWGLYIYFVSKLL